MPSDAVSPIVRRDFLTYATLGVAAVGSGAVVHGLGAAAVAPPQYEPTFSIDLNGIAEGAAVTVKFEGKPFVIRHRTALQIAGAEAVAVADLVDPKAENSNLDPDAPATDQNRRATADGRFIVMSMLCTHMGCVVLLNAGDFDGYFCPCHGAHYDAAGRMRKGPAPRNLPIPVIEISKTGILTMYRHDHLGPVKLDDLIYR